MGVLEFFLNDKLLSFCLQQNHKRNPNRVVKETNEVTINKIKYC